MSSTSELVTAEDLAARLHLSPETIRLWTRESFIPAIRITGKVIRYDTTEVVQALRRRSDERSEKGGHQ